MSVRWARMVEEPFDVAAAAEAGFTQVQLAVDRLMELSDAAFDRVAEELRVLGLTAEVCSSLLPSDVVVTESGFTLYVWAEYLQKAAGRMASLGVTKVAWNNGRARVLPLEENVVAVKEQVMQFLYVTCEIAEPYGITLLVEPLSPRRTNFLNTMEETTKLVDTVAKENLSSMISLRDLEEVGLESATLGRWKRWIRHVQLENPLGDKAGRAAPTPSDSYDYAAFLRALGEIGYDGVVALPEATGPEALAYLQGLT